MKQGENIKGEDKLSETIQNRAKDKLIMRMLLKTSRDATDAIKKERLMFLASQVERKGRGPSYHTKKSQNIGSQPAPKSRSLDQTNNKSERAKLGKRYTIDKDENQDQGPDKLQFHKRDFVDSLRALYEDVIG